MSDELRDRIEDTIEAAYAQWEFEFEAHEDGNRAYADPGPKDAFIAQAIIDDLGLEWSCDGAWLVPNEDEQMVPRAIRIVGKWERI